MYLKVSLKKISFAALFFNPLFSIWKSDYLSSLYMIFYLIILTF